MRIYPRCTSENFCSFVCVLLRACMRVYVRERAREFVCLLERERGVGGRHSDRETDRLPDKKGGEQRQTDRTKS